MKISSAYIDGFGIFHDLCIQGLDRNLVLFYGHNEAGKSTLLGFIRSVLFGFPRANSRDPAYLPTRGGVHGGRIDLLTGDRRAWSVSRKPGKGGGTVTVTGPDGRAHDQAMLDSLLGGISYEAFRSIMAFGLAELQTMDTLSGEHITSAIYGAGLGTSMNAMPRALKQIRKRMDDLFKNRASNPPVNLIAGELDQVRKELHEASLQAGQYDAAFDALTAVEKEIFSHREKLTDSRRRKQQVESLERLWPDWIQYQESGQALSELGPPAEKFPEDGLTMLETLAGRRERLENDLKGLKKRRDQLLNRFSLLPVDEKVLARAADITALVENRSTYLENSRRRPLLAREEQGLCEKIEQRLSHLGSHWTEEAVFGFDRSLFTRESIRNRQSSLDALEKKQASMKALHGDREAAFRQAEEAHLLTEKDLAELGDPPPARSEEDIQRLKQGRDRFLDALEEHKRLSIAHAEAQADLARLQEAAGKEGSGSKWPVALVAGLGAAAAGSIVFFGNIRDAAIVVGITIALAWATWVFRGQQRQIRTGRMDRAREQQRRVNELGERYEQLSSIKKDYLHLAEATGGAGTFDMPEEALPAALDRLFMALTEEDKRREAFAQARRRLDEKRAHEAAARRDLDKATAELEKIKKALEEEDSGWAEKCRDLGISARLSPATALEAIDVIDETAGIIQQRDRCGAEGARLEAELSGFRKTAAKIFSDIEWSVPAEGNLPQALNDLTARLEESRGNKREKETLEGQVKVIDVEEADTEKALLETGAAIGRLLEDADLADEAAFRKAGRIEERRAELLSTLRSAEGNMRRISGEVDSAELKARLEILSLADVIEQKEAATEEARDLDTDLSDLYARRAELRQTLESLSTSEDIARLRAREADLLSDLSGYARDWSRHAVAEHLILRAREIYEKKHQPEIIQDAGEIFSRMTVGRYRGVVAPLGENTVEAVDRNGERVPPDHLSRGTAEQLYLAVRFSYIRHQARKGDPLPVIMDDILVNFDPVRARKAAEAIMELSESHQVLIFTCHPETVTVFQDLNPELPVFTLDGNGICLPDPLPATEKSITA